MTNLLNNAYKYTEHGQILFGYAVVDSKVNFYVKDSGIGISDENISKIFDYFHKIEPDLEKFHQGTGIGLSICEKLVKQMGGSIEVKSEINKGSVFSFTLPITSSEKTDKRQEISDQDMINLEQTTILIAEDEPDNYYLIERILKKSGAKIVWAHNGKEAVDYFRDEHSCDNCLVLMDIKMPVMNGFEACITIKQLNKKIPIIALTAFALAQDKEKIMSAKFDDYISKPVNPERLWELLLYYHTKSKLLN
jgi:CheY-like chemotaxis protein